MHLTRKELNSKSGFGRTSWPNRRACSNKLRKHHRKRKSMENHPGNADCEYDQNGTELQTLEGGPNGDCVRADLRRYFKKCARSTSLSQAKGAQERLKHYRNDAIS